jgi:hypothetical protein
MTKDDIIKLAREAGLPDPMVFYAGYERFANLVAAHKAKVALAESYVALAESYLCGYEAGVVAERAECAKLIEAYPYWLGTIAKQEIAAAIRARGTT